jgi:hypothetical protein
MVIPLVAAARPVAALVFLCGLVPNFNGSPWDDAPPMEVPGFFNPIVVHDDGSTSWPNLEAAMSAFYPDCSAAEAAWAFARLRHQNVSSLWNSPYPLDSWPPGRRVAIIGADDEAVTPVYAKHVCRTRLGIEPIELPGGHSPFLARPAHLADALTSTVPAQT